jgi:hypothetical protein
MNSKTLGISALAIAAVLLACGLGTSSTVGIAVAPTATQVVVNTPAPMSAPQVTLAPTSLDPCQLVTAQEASSLAGTTLPAGTEGTQGSNIKTCTYGSMSSVMFIVDVAQAPDMASANAMVTQGKAALLAALQTFAKTGTSTVTPLPNLGDGGYLVTMSATVSGQTMNIAGISVRKGTTFFGLTDWATGQSATSSAALQSEAQTVLGRLP